MHRSSVIKTNKTLWRKTEIFKPPFQGTRFINLSLVVVIVDLNSEHTPLRYDAVHVRQTNHTDSTLCRAVEGSSNIIRVPRSRLIKRRLHHRQSRRQRQVDRQLIRLQDSASPLAFFSLRLIAGLSKRCLKLTIGTIQLSPCRLSATRFHNFVAKHLDFKTLDGFSLGLVARVIA